MRGIEILLRKGAALSAKIVDRTVSKVSVATSTAAYVLNSDGNVYNQNGVILETWRLVGLSSDFEVRATLTSGSFTAGTMGQWLPLTVSRTWSNTASVTGTINAGTMLVEIRTTAGTVLTSATVTVSAEKTP